VHTSIRNIGDERRRIKKIVNQWKILHNYSCVESEWFDNGHLEVLVINHFSSSSKRVVRLVMCQTFGTMKQKRGEVTLLFLF